MTWHETRQGFLVLIELYQTIPISGAKGFSFSGIKGTTQHYWPFYLHGITLIPAWTSNHTSSEVWDEITYPFLNSNGATIEV